MTTGARRGGAERAARARARAVDWGRSRAFVRSLLRGWGGSTRARGRTFGWRSLLFGLVRSAAYDTHVAPYDTLWQAVRFGSERARARGRSFVRSTVAFLPCCCCCCFGCVVSSSSSAARRGRIVDGGRGVGAAPPPRRRDDPPPRRTWRFGIDRRGREGVVIVVGGTRAPLVLSVAQRSAVTWCHAFVGCVFKGVSLEVRRTALLLSSSLALDRVSSSGCRRVS